MDGFEECPALPTVFTMVLSPRAACLPLPSAWENGNFLGKFPGRKGRECQPETVVPARQPLVHEDSRVHAGKSNARRRRQKAAAISK